MKKLVFFLAIIFSFLPNFFILAQESGAGFVPGNIWYSKDPFDAGDKIKIYTMLFNPDIREFSGTVIFFDKSLFLGKKDFVLKPKDATEISIDWTVVAGSHKIYAKIENAKFALGGGKYEPVYRSGNQTEENERTVASKIIIENDISTNKAEVKTSTNKNTEVAIDPVKELEEKIVSNTPKLISTPIIATANMLESVRTSASVATSNKKVEVSTAIKSLSSTNPKSEKAEKASKFIKPFKYVELFLITLLSYLFKYGVIFYGIICIVTFFIVRAIWRRVFYS
ncbi:MAG: hypothetical protein KBD55_00070 [Candidatus Pacebacteria bacterium]|nr:hypothetical protein [Candidatus Paceibacterota bacterium]